MRTKAINNPTKGNWEIFLLPFVVSAAVVVAAEAGDVELALAALPVALVHETPDSTLAVFVRVKSAHCSHMSIFTDER